MKKIGVYRITNKVNGKNYVGSSINLNSRFKDHYKGLKNKKHENPYLQRAWNKYGENNFVFEIIEETNKQLLLEREQYWMDTLKSHKNLNGYNISPTAKNSLGCKRTLKQRRRNKEVQLALCRSGEMLYNAKLTFKDADEIRKRYKEENVNSPMLAREYGIGRGLVGRILKYKSYVRPEDRNKNLAPIKKERFISPEGRRALSLAHIGVQAGEKHPLWGKPRSPETKEKLRIAKLGTKQSEETIRKRSEKMKGHKVSRETREKIRKAHLGENSCSSLLTWQKVEEIRKRWNSRQYEQKQLAKEYGVSRGCINNVVHHYTWRK